MEIKQYQIIIVNLDPTVGSEIRKTRPCVIISPDEMNKHLRTITIAPVTSKSKDYMTRVKFVFEGNDNWIAIDQIRTIDLTRIIKIIGELETKEIKKIKLIIKETFVD
ncbi:MAG: type II toxin-antitoxin system PemK/MazF family toxin [Bacteroidetes bacterium]|nr:type II toxin-antitoxin system PemK/MazF family toxin [Bacteroidota bacterium]